MKLRVGLVGLGDAWETRHRPALRALSDRFEVRAVCAEVALLAERTAVEFQATAVDGFRALTAREDIDAILMLSPQWYGPLPDPGGLRLRQGRLLRRGTGTGTRSGTAKCGSASNRRGSPSWPNCPADTLPPRCA